MDILFADDDPILREFALVQLASDTAQVRLAEDGREALAMACAATPDLIVLDLEMPHMDGFEVLAALRGDPRTAAIPVIVCTGREDIAAIDRAFEAGATSFIVKPINWRLLTHQIRFVFRAGRDESAARADLRALMDASEPLLLQAATGDAALRQSAATFARAVQHFARRSAAGPAGPRMKAVA